MDDIFVAIQYILDVSGEEDSSSLGKRLGFHYVGSGFAFFDVLVVLSELSELQRDGPCFWEEVVLFWEVLLHGHES